jgi:ubiquinone/menaquinone biosynthesis C-methylase UbiE
MKTTNTKSDGRFAGIVGEDYDRLLWAIPHIPAFEHEIAVRARQGLPKKLSRKAKILDLGCGNGMTTMALCAEVKNAHIVGIDIEPVMLKQYEAWANRHKSQFRESGILVNIRQSDALQFLKGCEASSFDVVVSGFVLHNLPQQVRGEIVKEIARVLRPNGRFVNGDKVARNDEDAHLRDFMKQLTTIVNVYSAPADRAYGIEWIEHYAKDNQPDLKYQESEVTDSLKVAGFTNVRIVKRWCMEAIVVADK